MAQTTSAKGSVLQQLRQNPYILGISTVSRLNTLLSFCGRLMKHCSLLHLEASSLDMIRV